MEREPQAGDMVERRAKAEENASQHDTYRTPSREHVTQALERVRQAGDCFIVTIRGGSRMRESRTYGSVRGGVQQCTSLPRSVFITSPYLVFGIDGWQKVLEHLEAALMPPAPQ